MLKSGKERRQKRKQYQLAERESSDGTLIARMNREQEEEEEIYRRWKRETWH